jgi:AraC-like DNA-binding protein
MAYQVFPVQHPALKPYIQAIWHVDEQVPYGREKILPTGTIELIINFGSAFRVIDKDNPQTFITANQSWLVGLQTEYIINEITGYSHMLGIRFKPGGIAPFFPHPASDFHNQMVALDAIWGNFADHLREQLLQIPTFQARIQHVEQALIKRLNIDEYAYLPIQFAVQEITRSDGIISIKSLSDTIGYSQKHLGNQFKRLVGITPKMLARVFRFQHVLQRIQPTGDSNWVEIAHTCHYHDQSHFNKEFTAFTGLTPSDYIDLRSKFITNLGATESGHFVPIG